jgi:hypothetical protein
MSVSMHEASVPLFQQLLASHLAIIGKAEAHALAKKIDPAALLQARLFPDMFAYVKQVQLSTDFANRCAARLSGSEIPSYPDDEQSFGELKARIHRTLSFLAGLKPEAFHGSDTKTFEIPVGGGKKEAMNGKTYLLHFAIPNFLFHVTTAYSILRHNGIEIGKGDFMMPPQNA